MTIFDVIKKPVLNTEKSRILLNSNEYVFIVDRRANKLQIKEAVEKLFNVKVSGVNTINMKPTTARARMTLYKTPAYKKAIVKLVDGESIKAYEV
ncbi:50S ribosomal protein L23 [Streptobacillus notomytis]|uniref:50S ribosomal protein L23 n=1 Tax=Streptobacillus notomytis TaxID=1712031 RepID=UPI00082EC327|nr:50S ribosomal protein L23 [Streptobacillus notomytis]